MFPKAVNVEICELLAEGHSCQQIADITGVPRSTVQMRRTQMLEAGDLTVIKHDEDDAHRRLWAAVIELAIRDLAAVDVLSGGDLNRAMRKKLRIAESVGDPTEFFQCADDGSETWFETICNMCGAEADKIRAGIRQRGIAL